MAEYYTADFKNIADIMNEDIIFAEESTFYRVGPKRNAYKPRYEIVMS